jgi:hypothetical protein
MEMHKMTVTCELIRSLLANYKKPEVLSEEHGLLVQLSNKLVERTLSFHGLADSSLKCNRLIMQL